MKKTYYEMLRDGDDFSNEIKENMLKVFTVGCRGKTKARFWWAVGNPFEKLAGIYKRVGIDQETGAIDYTAGQDYPSETRCVRECIMGT